jgi:hypothetical protein
LIVVYPTTKMMVCPPPNLLSIAVVAVLVLVYVGAFMADLAGRRSVLFPKIQREAGRQEILVEERSLCEVLAWEAFPHVL